MRRTGVLVLSLALGSLAACVAREHAAAMIHGTQPGSKISGQVTFAPTANGLKVSIRVANVPPGTHGIHFHEKGACADAGNAAGGHYNPDKVKHGFLPQDGFALAHAGDLGNIEVAKDGTGSLELTIPGLSLREGPHSIVGRALILHEKRDDFGQPTGNAGSRIGCGIITVADR